jgi:hypothetical protein
VRTFTGKVTLTGNFLIVRESVHDNVKFGLTIMCGWVFISQNVKLHQHASDLRQTRAHYMVMLDVMSRDITLGLKFFSFLF